MTAHKHALSVILEDTSSDSLVSEYEQLNRKFDSIISKIKVRKKKKRKKLAVPEVK